MLAWLPRELNLQERDFNRGAEIYRIQALSTNGENEPLMELTTRRNARYG